MWLAPSQPCLAPKGNGIKMTPIPGLNLLRTLVQACYQTTVLYIRKWWRNYKFQREFKNKFELLGDKRFKVAWKDRWPCLDDATSTTGFDAHYVYHTAWAARILAKQCPYHHIDIGSCLRFATLISAFIPVEFYDYRPAKIALSDLDCKEANVLALPFADQSVVSLSCMHVVEHIGLERYGDPFDPQGDVKAMRELTRVLAPGGDLFFVVPVGHEARIQYNAHRIYTYRQICDYFAELRLESFAFVTDSGEFISDACELSCVGQKYGCGCFHFMRPANDKAVS